MIVLQHLIFPKYFSVLQNDKSEKIENDFTFCVVTMDLSIVLHFFTAAKMAFYDTRSLCNCNVKHESAIAL